MADYDELLSDMSDDDQWVMDEERDPVDSTALLTGESPHEEDPEELYYKYRRAWRRYRKSIGKPYSRRSGRIHALRKFRNTSNAFRRPNPFKSRTFRARSFRRKSMGHFQADVEEDPLEAFFKSTKGKGKGKGRGEGRKNPADKSNG